MKIVAGPDVVEHIDAGGGQVFVWTVEMVYGYGFENVFTLEASTSSPGAEYQFVAFRGERFDLLYSSGDRGTPSEIRLRLTGGRRKTLRAYWDGHSFASGRSG